MLAFLVPMTALAPSAAELGSLLAVLLSCAGAAALAFPLARLAGLERLFRGREAVDPREIMRALIAAAGGPVRPEPAHPLVERALALAAAGGDSECIHRCLSEHAPRPWLTLAPAAGLIVSLACMVGLAGAARVDAIPLSLFAVGSLAVTLIAFLLAAVAGSVMDRASRLDPGEVVAWAMLGEACPAIRDGAGPAAVQQILRPFVPTRSAHPIGGACEGRMAA